MPNTVKEKKHECMSDLRHKRKISNIRRKSVNKRYIICLTELSPCSCMNHDSLVPSSVQMDQEEEVVDGGGEPEEESQSLLKDYNASLYN